MINRGSRQKKINNFHRCIYYVFLRNDSYKWETENVLTIRKFYDDRDHCKINTVLSKRRLCEMKVRRAELVCASWHTACENHLGWVPLSFSIGSSSSKLTVDCFEETCCALGLDIRLKILFNLDILERTNFQEELKYVRQGHLFALWHLYVSKIIIA